MEGINEILKSKLKSGYPGISSIDKKVTEAEQHIRITQEQE